LVTTFLTTIANSNDQDKAKIAEVVCLFMGELATQVPAAHPLAAAMNGYAAHDARRVIDNAASIARTLGSGA
jgi:hypothetical protein